MKENKWDGLGMRGNASMPVCYNDVELDTFYRVGKEGDGGNQAMSITALFCIWSWCLFIADLLGMLIIVYWIIQRIENILMENLYLI